MAEILFTNLPVAVSLDGSEVVPIDQSNGDGTYTTRRTTTSAVSSLGFAAEFVLVALNENVPQARVLAGADGQLTVTDGGAGGNITVGLASSGVTPGTYGDGTHVAQVVVDNAGRVTSATNVSITHVGDVTSVGLALPGDFTVSGSPVTSSGTLTADWATPPTGTGAVVRADSPTLVTPTIGAATGTSLQLSGLTPSSAVATDASRNLVSVTNTGSGNNVLAMSPTLVTPNLGTPSAVTLTNGTGLPISSGVSGLGSGVATFLATPSSANLKAAVTDETGSGALVFATSPTMVTPNLGTPSAIDLTNATNLPIALVTAALLTLPTTLPGSSGQLWWNGGVLSKS